MDLSPLYRLKSVSKDAILYYEEKGNIYETVERYALYWKEQLCIEHYYSEHGPDYFTTQRFFLYSVEDTKKLVDYFGSVENMYKEIMDKGRVEGEFARSNIPFYVSPKELRENPFKEDIDAGIHG